MSDDSESSAGEHSADDMESNMSNESFSCINVMNSDAWPYWEQCINTVITGLLLLIIAVLVVVLICICLLYCKRRKRKSRSYEFPEEQVTDEENQPSQGQPKRSLTFMRNQKKKAAANASSTGVYSSIHMSTFYDEIKAENTPAPPPPLPPTPSSSVARDGHNYSIVNKKQGKQGEFTTSLPTNVKTSTHPSNQQYDKIDDKTDVCEVPVLVTVSQVPMPPHTQMSPVHDHLESSSPTYANTSLPSKSSLHTRTAAGHKEEQKPLINQAKPSDDTTMAAKSASQELVAEKGEFYSLDPREGSSSYSLATGQRMLGDQFPPRDLLPAAYEEFYSTPAIDVNPVRCASPTLPLEESLYSDVNERSFRSSHTRANSERVRRSSMLKQVSAGSKLGTQGKPHTPQCPPSIADIKKPRRPTLQPVADSPVKDTQPPKQ